MDKIVGFLITREEKKNLNIDYFNRGLRLIEMNSGKYKIYIWGIGDISKCKIQRKYSLSFPLHDNLLDRNVFLSIEDDTITVENDWLGSIPVFYNLKECIISTIPNFCLKDKTIDKEGLLDFCEFGYSVFEQTIFKDIKFMRYYSRLIISDSGIKIEYKEDPVLSETFLEKIYNEYETIDLIKSYISSIEFKIDGDIVIPTSGGYDSRLLNYLVNDKKRIRSFTYGISKDQSKSYEVVHAKKISEILGTQWKQIELRDYLKYIDKWFEIYGFSTHLHGMYNIEFYTKILENYKLINPSLLSGIIGDAWAGSINHKNITKLQDMIYLGYTHGVSLESKFLNFKFESKKRKLMFLELKEHLENSKIQTVFIIRTKIILISYLTIIPEYFGIPVWTPFLNFEIVKAILNIDEKKRKNRIWQRDFFRRVGLNLEDMNLKIDRTNRLDYDISRKNERLEELDVKLMRDYFSEKRLHWINKMIGGAGLFENLKNEFLYIRKIGGLLRRLGFKNNHLKALDEYYIIKAIEKGLKYES